MTRPLDQVIGEAVLCASSPAELNILQTCSNEEFKLVRKILDTNIKRLEELYARYADNTVQDDQFRLSAILIKGKLLALKELASAINRGG